MDFMDLYTCRTCLSREKRENVKSILGDRLSIHTYSVKISIIEAFNEITRLVVDENEAITHFICLNCVRRLRQAMLFRMTAVKSYERLASIGPESYDDEEPYCGAASPGSSPEVVPKMEITEEYLEAQFLDDDEEDDNEEMVHEVKSESLTTRSPEVKFKVEMAYENKKVNVQPPKKRRTYKSSPQIKTEKQQYFCDFCSTELPNKRSTFLHLKKYHMSKKPYKCWIEGCGRLYVSPAQRRFHQEAIHFKIKPYVCDFCGLCFTDNAKLQSHRRVHTGERPYKCDFPGCTSAFKQPYDYVKHKMSIHSDERKFSCEECGATFKLKGGLRAHKRLMHSKDNLKCCPECTKQFLNAAALNNHIGVVHRGERNHVCSVCGRTYAYRKHLIRHIKDSHPQEHQAMKDSGEIVSRIKTQLVPIYEDDAQPSQPHEEIDQKPPQKIQVLYHEPHGGEMFHAVSEVREPQIVSRIKTQMVSMYQTPVETEIITSDIILAPQRCNELRH